MLCSERNKSFKTVSPVATAEKKRTGLSTTAIASAILFFLVAALFVLPGCGKSNSDTDPVSKAKVGDVVPFGDYQWRVLAKENGKALVITEDVIENRAYIEKNAEVTWENCTLRSYLNDEFYNGFNDNQKKAIADTKNANPANSEFGTSGGSETTDKVFCLSIDEANKYFSSDDNRIAKYNGDACRWWLRSPGYDAGYAGYVDVDGNVDGWGFFVDNEYTGVRPALWVNI